jgi:hypothetical protein
MRTTLVLLWAAAVCHADVEDRLNRSVAAKPGGRLIMDTQYGSIELRGGDVSNIELELYRRIEEGREDPRAILSDLDLQLAEAGGEVRIRAEFRTGWVPRDQVPRGGRRMCHNDRCLAWAPQLKEMRFRLTVPRQFHVDLATSGGSIAVDDLTGEARTRTSGGSLRFGQVRGPVNGRTSGGSITLDRSSGPAELKTSGGSIRIGEVAGEVTAHTSGGSINIERAAGRVLARTSGGSINVRDVSGDLDASTSGGSVNAHISGQPKGPCRLSTSGGNIVVYLDRSTRLDLDAHTSSGRVHTDFPVVVQGTLDRGTLKSPINGGGPLLHLRTSGGSITIRSGGGTMI